MVEIGANYPGILLLEPLCVPVAREHGEEVLIGMCSVAITNQCDVALPNLPVMLLCVFLQALEKSPSS